MIAAIQVIHRSPGPDRPAASRFYAPDWRAFDDPMCKHLPHAPASHPPACLAEMLEAARTIASAVGGYLRVDLYATSRGCVFGELSSTPRSGEDFTPFADEYFESLWRRHCPEEV